MSKAYRTIQSSKYEGKVTREDVAAAVLLVSQSSIVPGFNKKAPAKKLAAKTAFRTRKSLPKPAKGLRLAKD